jgi:UDP-N-acetylmuramoyl-tripeptide--D-alanyl-D-alanine ligase
VIALSATEAARALGVDEVAETVTGVSTDTRALVPGDLFVALVGERYDGHAFVPAAFAAGASCAVVEMGRSIAGIHEWKPPTGDGRLYRVPDSLRALGALGQAVRRLSSAIVIGVTGSVGKTGTKDLIRAMALETGPVVATEANLNNEIGVPITLLRLEPSTRVAVIEMGMRGRGQISSLSVLTEPDVALITRLAPVHLEAVGTMEEVARAKTEILEGLRPGGVAVIPAGVDLLEALAADCRFPIVRFALLKNAGASNTGAAFLPGPDVTGLLVLGPGGQRLFRLVWPGGETTITAPFTAPHKLENAVAATAACYAAGLPVEECVRGFDSATLTPGRGDVLRLGDMLLLDDTYNANPVSMRAALDWLVEMATEEGRRAVAIVGDMMELGPDAAAYHREVGRHAAHAGVEGLWATGEYAQFVVDGFCSGGAPAEAASIFTMDESAQGRRPDNGAPLVAGLAAVVREVGAQDAVLVKASRSVRLERVVSALRAHCAEVAGAAEA